MNQKIIALDADGVLVDYNLAYAAAWERAFGVYPKEKDPQAYWTLDRWEVEHLSGERLDRLRSSMNESHWENIPAMSGALEACLTLRNAGYRLVCVTAVAEQFALARQRNLRKLGFPIDTVIATGSVDMGRSPKADALHALKPVAFVDDFLPYMLGLQADIHLALILRDPKGSPNMGEQLHKVTSTHTSLLDFSRWWIGQQQ